MIRNNKRRSRASSRTDQQKAYENENEKNVYSKTHSEEDTEFEQVSMKTADF